ncbi:MAG: hypothetical protein JXR40_03835 [Pontiellaceae bacterium]|nr:hypothetical protein [Pontiellaceae bacterium]
MKHERFSVVDVLDNGTKKPRRCVYLSTHRGKLGQVHKVINERGLIEFVNNQRATLMHIADPHPNHLRAYALSAEEPERLDREEWAARYNMGLVG